MGQLGDGIGSLFLISNLMAEWLALVAPAPAAVPAAAVQRVIILAWSMPLRRTHIDMRQLVLRPNNKYDYRHKQYSQRAFMANDMAIIDATRWTRWTLAIIDCCGVGGGVIVGSMLPLQAAILLLSPLQHANCRRTKRFPKSRGRFPVLPERTYFEKQVRDLAKRKRWEKAREKV